MLRWTDYLFVAHKDVSVAIELILQGHHFMGPIANDGTKYSNTNDPETSFGEPLEFTANHAAIEHPFVVY